MLKRKTNLGSFWRESRRSQGTRAEKVQNFR